jgi:carboxyl-terminal processing protease
MIHASTRSPTRLLILFLVTTWMVGQAAASVQPPRAALVERIIATAEAAVANPEFVSGDPWERFTRTIRDPDIQSLDDEAFRQAFNDAADALPFTHLRLHWQPGVRSGSEDKAPAFKLSWPRERIARIQVRQFEGDPTVISDLMSQIMSGGADALIIDLRGTPGGSFPTAAALSRALRREAIDTGAYLTRDWFIRHGDYPDAAQYEAIAAIEELDLAGFTAQLQRDGAARLILPAHDDPIFGGDLVILTDGATGSTAEPMVYLLQQQGVTVIGERTFGGMLSAQHFAMDETFRLFVPVADYVTPDLVRLDRNGVQPTIQVPADQALERALALIEERVSD